MTAMRAGRDTSWAGDASPREGPAAHLQRPVRVLEARRDGAHIGMLVHVGDHALERPGKHHDIRIGHEDIAASAPGDRLVVAAAETTVLFVEDQLACINK